MVDEKTRSGRARTLLSYAITLVRWLGAVACLAGVYLAAVSTWDLRWVALAAVGALIVATGPPRWTLPETMPRKLPWPSRSHLWLGLLPGWVITAAAGPAKLSGLSSRVLIWVWFVGVCWLLVAAWRTARSMERPSEPSPRSSWVWLLIVLGIAFFLRAAAIDMVPRDVHGDETATTFRALAFYANPARDWFGADILMNLLYAVAGWGNLIFGVNLTGARTSDVVLGTLSVGLLFDALRRVSTLRLAIIGSLLLATSHVHIAYSRNAAGYIQSAFVVAFLLAAAARLWTAPSVFNAVLLGTVAGIGVNTIPASVASVPLLMVTLLMLVLLNPARARALLVPLTIATVTSACVFAPFAAGIWQNRAGLTQRSGGINIFVPSKMQSLKDNVYHTDSTLKVVAWQAWNGLTGFQRGQNGQPQYPTARPMADGYSAALMIAGVIFAAACLRQFAAASALVITVGYLLLGLGMHYAPGFQRAAGGFPTGMVLAAIGLVQCCETFWGGRMRLTRWACDLSLAIAVIVCALVNLRFYFIDCRAMVLYAAPDSEAAWAAREYARHYHVHLVDWRKPGIDDLPLITEDLPVFWNQMKDPLTYASTVEVSGANLFIVKEDDKAARDALLARFPDARVELRRRHKVYGPMLILVFVDAPGGGKGSDGNRPPSDSTWASAFHSLSAALAHAVENYGFRRL